MERPPAANAARRCRLAVLRSRRQAGDVAPGLGDGWTAGAARARPAFRDRSGRPRWESCRRHGSVEEFPDALVDTGIPAGVPHRRGLPAAVADLVHATARAVGAPVVALPDAAVAHAGANGRRVLVVRPGRRHANPAWFATGANGGAS